jgi:hypothetical protein
MPTAAARATGTIALGKQRGAPAQPCRVREGTMTTAMTTTTTTTRERERECE